MALICNEKHEEHLARLNNFDLKAIEKFSETAVEYIIRGPKLYESFDPQLVHVDQVRNVAETVDSLVFVYLECVKADISAENLEKFLKTIDLNSQKVAAISNEYREKKRRIRELSEESDNLLYYHDVRWRFEAKISSRSLLNQMVPLITIELKFGDSPNAAGTTRLKHAILQIDPITLVYMANSLERALNATRSRHVRKLEKQMYKLTME